MRIPLLKKLKNIIPVKTADSPAPAESTKDRININLWGLDLAISRDTTLDVPSEMSVIIPRVELRQKYTPSPNPVYETEIIMSSITVVLAPRHAPGNESPPGTPVSSHLKRM